MIKKKKKSQNYKEPFIQKILSEYIKENYIYKIK